MSDLPNSAWREELVTSLFELGVVRFGEFTLKSGEISPVYLDLRLLIDKPVVLKQVAAAMHARSAGLAFDRFAAIPLAGMPIGVALSLQAGVPLVYPRMQAKQHGTGRIVEGSFQTGEVVLVVDDVISRGDSKLEALEQLWSAGLVVKDMLVIVDRQMGGVEMMRKHGCTVHYLLTLPEMMDTLLAQGKISGNTHAGVMQWLAGR